MRKNTRISMRVGVVVGTVAALLVGAVGGQAIAMTLGGNEDLRRQAAAQLPPIETNAAGLTFGSIAHATSPGDAPDLVLVTSDSGADGYVYWSEFYEEAPASPQEALARSASDRQRVLVVYRSDGTTAIDTFTFSQAE